MDDWAEIRQEWNRAGLCSREACKKPMGPVRYEYPDDYRLLYCEKCKDLLEMHQYPLRLKPVDIVNPWKQREQSIFFLHAVEEEEEVRLFGPKQAWYNALPDLSASGLPRRSVSPFDADCQRCGAKAGESCVGLTGKPRDLHSARKKGTR